MSSNNTLFSTKNLPSNYAITISVSVKSSGISVDSKKIYLKHVLPRACDGFSHASPWLK